MPLLFKNIFSQFTDPSYWILLCLTLPTILFSLTFHEASHAFMANKLGDETARNMGRLTLNPAKHLDPIGTICMVLFHFGWAKPVPINSRNFDNPKKGMALTAIAGPLSNLLLAAGGVILYSFVYELMYRTGFSASHETVTDMIREFLFYFFVLNVYLAVFNLLPIPPLDGSRLAFLILPDRWYWGIMKYERIIMIVMLALLWTGVLSFPLQWISGKIMWLFELPFELIPFFRNVVFAI